MKTREKELILSKNALTVLKKRYLKKNKEGRIIETPFEMFKRVARNIASADLIYDKGANIKKREEEFLAIMVNLEFLPNSPALMNAGRELQQLAACFVLPVEDSLSSIFDTIKHTALIHRSGGGTGFSFSKLRPANDRVLSTSGIASGPVSFMKVFNMATEVIKQGGTRRGANMGILRVDHPDIIDFVRAKDDPKELTNFNISVGVTDEFMNAVETGRGYYLINPRDKKKVKRLSAVKVFDIIVGSAWRSGEPGIIFLDRINKDNPTPDIGEIEATNPCGEQPLLPFESCNLGSINLSKMVINKHRGFEIDYKRLEEVIRIGVRFLDNIIDVNRYPLPEIERITKGNRKIGLGVMGFADMLIKLGIPYDSEDAIDQADRVMGFIRRISDEISSEIAKERGPYPHFFQVRNKKRGSQAMRNATRTTVAPTGTLSIIANCSSGIEPLYGIAYVRTVMDGIRLLEVNPIFLEMAKERSFYSKGLIGLLSKQESIRELEDIPEDIRRLFVTSHDISPEFHVRMQAAFQRHTDNAVSKTINFPNNAGRGDIKRAFLLAYKEGCKGITIYRSGAREKQVLACKGIQYC